MVYSSPYSYFVMRVLLYLVLICLLVNESVGGFSSTTIPMLSENNDPTPVMVEREGYTCEVHHVETEDGFILQVHRLPGGKTKPLDPRLAPVILQHGLLDSSADWVINGPYKALAYLLADQGYDVWLGNARGNIYSKAHRTLPVTDKRFWNWSWHEMGVYDLPALIDYVLQNRKDHSQVYYVGHSMGTTMFFVMASTRPEYNSKIRYMAALAPVAFMQHSTSPLRLLSPFITSMEVVAQIFGYAEFLPRTPELIRLLNMSCEQSKFKEIICGNIIFYLIGYDEEQFDEKLLPVILGHNPAGTSTKTVVHFAQETVLRTNRFQMYDYGVIRNKDMYNSTTPPSYDLSLITTPVSLHYGDNDLLSNPKDVKYLKNHLSNPLGMFRVNHSCWNHGDFIWAKNVKDLLYNDIIDLMALFR